MGSFLGVLVDRAPAETGVLTGRSECASCGRSLQTRDLVPILSWIWLRGKCRACRAPIGLRPLLMEAGVCALFILAAVVAVDVWQVALLGPFLGVLLSLTLIDVEHRRLPNVIVYPSVGAAAILVAIADLAGGDLSASKAAIGSVAFGGSLLLVAIVSRGGMGLGDVKLAFFIGLVVGAVDLPSVGVAAGGAILMGGLVATLALIRGAGRRTAIPFGPMLAAGALMAVTVGGPIASGYMGLLT